VAGAPPNPLARFNALQLWPGWLINQDPTRLIPRSKYTMVHDAVLKTCASALGLKDGVVDKTDCNFDPKQLLCKGADAPDCLTASQVYLLQKTYEGPVNPRTKELIFPGPAPGSEFEMFGFANGRSPTVALDLFRYVAFQDANWDLKAMDWDQDITAAIAKVAPLLHVDSDLKPFFDHGGKLLLYVGWADYHNPQELIAYYKSLIRNSGSERARTSVRLFTIPGMAHCAGGAGCDTFDKLGTIDEWVIHSKTPESIIASRIRDGKIVRTRPLCAYPAVARHKGTGTTDEATNFVCAAE
jgi:feruloyl esterase